VEVVPDRESLRPSCRAAPQADLGPRRRARPGPSRRALTLLAVAFGSLAFSAAAHAALDEPTAESDPSATPPAATAAAAAPAAADAVQAAVTTAAANEGESAVSAQYQGETGENREVATRAAKAARAAARAGAIPALRRPSGRSTSSQANPAAAANRLLNTHGASRSVERRVSDIRPPAEQRAASGSSREQRQLRAPWYQPRNSQYQFDSEMRTAGLHITARISSGTAGERTGYHPSVIAAKSALIHLITHTAKLEDEPTAGPVSAASMSAANQLQVAVCRVLTSRLDTRNCAVARRRYQANQPQYRPDPSQRDAASNVIVKLGEAAAQLAVRGAVAAHPPPPQGPDVRPTTTPGSPLAEARPFLLRAPAAVVRTLSVLVKPRPPRLAAAARAARIAQRIAKSLGLGLLQELGAFPRPSAIVGRAPSAAHLTDNRRLLQIGLAFGIAYFVFLTFWFWRTRGRHRGLRGGARF
jgi:hypothetical protein